MTARYLPERDPERTIIRARFSSRCITCDRAIRVGDDAGYARGRGVLCTTCLRLERRPAWRGAEVVSVRVVERPATAFVVVPAMPRKVRS